MATLPPVSRDSTSVRVRAEHRHIRHLVWIFGLALIGVALLLGPVRGWLGSHRSPPPPRYLADFALTDHTGRVVTRADLSNQFLIVSCMFTSCSLSCLAVNERMAEIQRLVADRPGVRLISLTVDPRTDTPPVLARFAERYGADRRRWLFLTGDKAVLYPLLETSFLRPAIELAGIVPGGFADLDRIFLVDSSGAVRATFDGLKPSTPREVVTLLDRLHPVTSPP